MPNISFKTLPKAALVLLLLLMVTITGAKAPIMAANNENAASEGRIITTGYAELAVVPDTATVTIGAQHTDRTATIAQAEVAKRIEAILIALRKAGIPDNAIRTSTFRVGPQYDYKDGERILRGHTVTHQLSVTINNLSTLGALLDTVVSVGATSIDNIQFNTSNAAELQRQALRLAVEDAKQKADALAAGAGVAKLRVIRIQDGSPQVRQPQYDLGGEAVAFLKASTEVAPGEVTISASVTVEYAFD